MQGFAYFFVILVSVQALVLALPIPRKRAGDFSADPSINAEGIFAAAKTGKQSLANFPSSPGGSNVDIFGDWVDLMNGDPVFQFTADMDVDCDGVDVREL
jgi:chitosanase